MLARFAASSRSLRAHPARAERPRATALAVAVARPAPAEPVRVRFPGGPAHGFVDLIGPRIAE